MYQLWGGLAAVVGALPDAKDACVADSSLRDQLAKLDKLDQAPTFQALCTTLQSPGCSFTEEEVNRLNSPLLDALLCGIFGESPDARGFPPQEGNYDFLLSFQLSVPVCRNALTQQQVCTKVHPAKFFERCAHYNSDACVIRYCADRFGRLERGLLVDVFGRRACLGMSKHEREGFLEACQATRYCLLRIAAQDRHALLAAWMEYLPLTQGDADELLRSAAASGSLNSVDLILQRHQFTFTVLRTVLAYALQRRRSVTIAHISPLLIALGDFATFGPLALSLAAANDSLDVVRWLLDQGLDVNVTFGTERSPLNAACSSNSVEVVKLLVERGADISADNFQCIVHAAGALGGDDSRATCLYLIDRGAPVGLVAKHIFPRAVRMLDTEMLKVCVRHGVRMVDHQECYDGVLSLIAFSERTDLQELIDMILDAIRAPQTELNSIFRVTSSSYFARALVRKGARFQPLEPICDTLPVADQALCDDCVADIELYVKCGYSDPICVEWMQREAVRLGSARCMLYLLNRFGDVTLLPPLRVLNPDSLSARVKYGSLQQWKQLVHRLAVGFNLKQVLRLALYYELNDLVRYMLTQWTFLPAQARPLVEKARSYQAARYCKDGVWDSVALARFNACIDVLLVRVAASLVCHRMLVHVMTGLIFASPLRALL